MLVSLATRGQEKTEYTLCIKAWNQIGNIGTQLDTAILIVENMKTKVELKGDTDSIVFGIHFKLEKAVYEVTCIKSGYDTTRVIIDLTKKPGQFVNDKDLKKCQFDANIYDKMSYTLFMYLNRTGVKSKSGVRIVPHKEN